MTRPVPPNGATHSEAQESSPPSLGVKNAANVAAAVGHLTDPRPQRADDPDTPDFQTPTVELPPGAYGQETVIIQPTKSDSI